MSNIIDLSVAQLKRAVQIKEQIEKLQADLASVLGSAPSRQAIPSKGGMSEATKAKLRAAAKARWAKVNSGNKATPATKSVSSGRKPMSAAAKARLSALMKAKWAAKNKGGKTSTPTSKAAPKKSTMSAAAKARLSALAKARWVKVKASGKKGF